MGSGPAETSLCPRGRSAAGEGLRDVFGDEEREDFWKPRAGSEEKFGVCCERVVVRVVDPWRELGWV